MMYQTLIEPVDKFVAYNYPEVTFLVFVVALVAIVFAYVFKTIVQNNKEKAINNPKAIREYLLNQPAD